MGKVETLSRNLSSVENNISIYDQEIESIKEKIDGIVAILKANDPYNEETNASLSFYLSTNVSDFSSLEVGLVPIKALDTGDEIIDYSVDASNLTLEKEYTIDGKKVRLYTSNKTDALYVITDGFNSKEKKTLISSLKGILTNDQMAIITYHNDFYHYDIKNSKKCTSDYAVVGKTSEGKMYSFTPSKKSVVIVDDGGKNDTLLTSINGLILMDRMHITIETNAKVNLRVRVKDNVDGGQIVTEFERLSFSGGVKKSLGSEYARVYMDGEWQNYASTRENKARGTWVNETVNNYVVTVGAGPQRKYFKKYKSVGHVDGKVIPIIIETGNKCGDQHMQGTVCYHHDGARPGHMSKDMLSFSQRIVSDWNNL